MTTGKQVVEKGSGPTGPSPAITVKATKKLLLGGKTIYPGGALTLDPFAASNLVKAGLAEFIKPTKERAVVKPKEKR